MKKNWLRILCLSLFTLGLYLVPASAAAQSADTAPKIVMVISLQQDSLRIGDQVQGVLEISNQSNVAAGGARFSAALPDFLVLHAGACDAPVLTGGLDLGPLPAHSVKTQAFCLNLDRGLARAGSFNLLFKITYTWDQDTDLTTSEKTVQVDLIGNQTILGLPLAFAGFILPGLAVLITLRWRKMPWAVALSGEDRLIYGVLISLLLLGPFALIGSLPGVPGWVQVLNFNQQVTIERLVGYVLFGFALGLFAAWVYGKYRACVEKKLEAAQLSKNDDFKTVIQKSLLLNPDYHGGRVSIMPRKEGKPGYQGAHYIEASGKLYLFPEFRLKLSQLDDQTRARVVKIAGPAKDFSARRDLILDVLSVIRKPPKDLIQISNPIVETKSDNTGQPIFPDQPFMVLEAADFEGPIISKNHATVLLDIQGLTTNGRLAATTDQKSPS